MIGSIVGNYKIISELGEGGVGTVYKGVDTMLDREVAIKVLRPELVSNDSVVDRFRSEAVTLAKLNHPNIATLFSLFRHGNELFMVLEFVEGETVEDILQRRGIISVEEALPFFCQALNGLNYAHQLQIVHRDIKPSNMILTKDNVLKILDFGIARLLGSSRMTKVGNIIGTLEYMSPEQIRGEDTDARSDIYGLGIMLYEILTGKLPFDTENEFALMKAHTEEMPVLPRQINPQIPVEIESAIIRAIAKNPEERFQDADEFLQTLLDLGFSATENPALGFESLYQSKVSANRRKTANKNYNSKDFPTDLTLPTFNLADAGLEGLMNEGEKTEPLPSTQAKTEPLPSTQAKTEPLPSTQEKSVQESAIATAQLPDLGETQEVPVEKTEVEKPEIKETRLGEASNIPPVVTPPKEIKPTRLGAIEAGTAGRTRQVSSPEATQQSGNPAEKPNPAAIFKKLNWIHYAGAGVIAFIFLSVIGIIAVSAFMFSGGRNEQPSTPVVNSQPAEEKPVKPNDEGETKTIPDTASKPVNTEPTPIGDSNVELPEEDPQPTPVEVAKDKPRESSGGTKKGGSTKKDSGTKKGGSTKKDDNTKKGGSTKKGSGTKPNIVKDMTKTGPKTSKTPSMTDN